MQAGSLTTPIGIYRNEAVQSDTGYTPDNWVEVARRRAHVVSQRGSKALNNGSVWYPTARVVRVRKPLDIDESCRVKIDGVMYEIINVDSLARDSITLNCSQVNGCD
jgi:head-tail adaptor